MNPKTDLLFKLKETQIIKEKTSLVTDVAGEKFKKSLFGYKNNDAIKSAIFSEEEMSSYLENSDSTLPKGKTNVQKEMTLEEQKQFLQQQLEELK